MPIGEEYSQGVLVPVDDDPFAAAAPSSGNILDPASQPVSSWADSPLAKVGRLIGEHGLPGRTVGAPAESMPDFWKRWPEMIAKLTGKNAAAPASSDQNNSYKLVPVEHDPFAPKKMSAFRGAADLAAPPQEGPQPVYPIPPTRDPNDPMVNVERSLSLPPDRNSFMPQDVMDYRGSLPPPRDI